ncbi:MAG: lipopolysaccharide kinase InaA family protein [Oligosphaeraceae bacterium]
MRIVINPRYASLLSSLGLDTPQGLLGHEGGECVSRHTRGATFRIPLEDGRVLFLKKDYYTKPAAILHRLARFKAPETNTEREVRLLENARAKGFRVPEILAYLRHTPWLPPRRGAMLQLALEGTPVEALVRSPQVSPEVKERALEKARETLDRLQEAGLDWNRDCKPEHFFYCPDGEIALLDGERLYPARAPLTREYRAGQHQRFDSFLPPEYRRS